jgi:hypothetical protein
MLQIGLGFVELGNGELLRHRTVSKSGDLWKDKPDSVTRLSPGSQLSKDCVIDALLRVEKAVELVSGAHKLSSTKYILSRMISCLAMLDCKT